MYKVIKTNKVPVEKTFNTLEELSEYASKNKFTKGRVSLFKDNTEVDEVRDSHSLATWTTHSVLIERGVITE